MSEEKWTWRWRSDLHASKQEKEERAHLMKAAPKLYEALDNLVALHVREMEGLQFSQPGPEEWINAVETAASAMAQARGES